MNDRISSIHNHANHMQAFDEHSDYRGARLDVGSHIYVRNLVSPGWNDRISYVIWIG